MNEKIKQILEETINKLESCKNPKIKSVVKKIKKAKSKI
jgi:hypothetical protein